jgi:crotonobetainyl-CoA:carnitine CoA-transferase CaiB-like acyl-CoA transferase
VTVEDPRVGEVVLPAGVPTMSETPPELRHTGRAKGQDTDEVLRQLLGVSAEDLERLRANAVI